MNTEENLSQEEYDFDTQKSDAFSDYLLKDQLVDGRQINYLLDNSIKYIALVNWLNLGIVLYCFFRIYLSVTELLLPNNNLSDIIFLLCAISLYGFMGFLIGYEIAGRYSYSNDLKRQVDKFNRFGWTSTKPIFNELHKNTKGSFNFQGVSGSLIVKYYIFFRIVYYLSTKY